MPNQHVVPNGEGGWKVQGAGNDRASRITETKREAINIAREIARNQGTELIIHGEDGKNQETAMGAIHTLQEVKRKHPMYLVGKPLRTSDELQQAIDRAIPVAVFQHGKMIDKGGLIASQTAQALLTAHTSLSPPVSFELG